MPQKRAPWEIYVNAIGERFVREDEASVDLREHALRHQPDLRYWIVFDRAILDQAPVGVQGWTREELMARFNHHPMFQQADTLEELAKRIGANPATLASTVRRYNEGVRSGHDALGRTNLPRVIDGAPYFAVRQQGYSITSTVGLAVDKQLRVVRPGGEPVVNLYAAGELLGSGQTMGNAFVGGMMVTPAITFGRLLGSSLPIGPA
jgi:fumarate reductase flavoprotein subunit